MREMSLEQEKQVTLQVQPHAASDEPHTVKCPNCDADISEVKVYCLEENSYRVSLAENSYGKELLDWTESDCVEGTCQYGDVECPNCQMIMFRIKGEPSDSEELKEFLRTGEVPVDREEHGVPIPTGEAA